MFLNRCRHRGAKLLEDGEVYRGLVACPYHAWSYDTSGALKSIYGKNHRIENWQTLSLQEVPSFIAGGFIWANPENRRSIFDDFGKEISLLGIGAPRIVSEFQHDTLDGLRIDRARHPNISKFLSFARFIISWESC